MGSRRRQILNEGWHFRQADAVSQFRDTQGFPTEIHLDLLHHGLIEDPFRGKNETKVQWVGEASWIYKTTFTTPFIRKNEKAVLCFEGLDTYATVSLNDKTILKSSNMFLPQEVDIRDLLRAQGEYNTIVIVFKSAWSKGKDIMLQHPDHPWICSNGDPSRLAVRKAQYHYGWDWGPRLVTCGPWRPIYLDIFSSRILEVKVTSSVASDLSCAEIQIKAIIEGAADRVRVSVSLEERSIGQETVDVEDGWIKATFLARSPKLWYPRRYGEQPLYAVDVALLNESESVIDRAQRKIGLRKARIVQEELDDTEGTSFVVEMNDIPIFCGGSNWIPADSFVTRLTPARYRDWINVIVAGNQNLIRIWGGGIWESDAFYDACDELGILVWQDFMFACGNYPAHDDFLDSVKKEAVANIKRLHSHPCIVIWAGNNEDYQIAESEGLEYDRNDHDPEHWLQSNFPARYIYEKILPGAMANNAPSAFYHPGSPYGCKSSGDPKSGDIHQWNVWHGTQEPYQNWDKLAGRFVSEFGMQGLPDMRTVDQFFNDGESMERYPESSTTSHHNKAVGHDRRLGLYLTENLCYQFQPFDQYVYCTQVMQAECFASAFRAWKRQWKGPGKRYCAGALVWQANDCWPCTSWAIVDYYMRPKLAYFAVKREMDALTLGMKRFVNGVADQKLHQIELWACNISLKAEQLDICIETYNCDNGKHKRHTNVGWQIQALPNRTTEIATFEIPRTDVNDDAPDQTVIVGTFSSQKSRGYAVNWPEPLKFVHLPQADLQINVTEPAKSLPHVDLDRVASSQISPQTRWLQFRSNAPLKSLFIELLDSGDGSSPTLGGNGLDIPPNRWIAVQVGGLTDFTHLKVRSRHLGSKVSGYQDVQVVNRLYASTVDFPSCAVGK